MRVGLIGHSGVVVSSGKTHCFMDPVLFSPFEAGANRFDPPFQVDLAAARQQCTLIVVSHHHGDHFCPRSLNVFRRSCPVIYPAGSHSIERVLARLGFELRLPLPPGGQVEIEGLALTATGSRVSFPEIGIVFRAEGRSFWNTVDSVLSESILGAARGDGPPPDLLFTQYQPLIEMQLQEDSLGAAFPLEVYGGYLRDALSIHPRCVVPAAAGFRYTENWVNQRGLPMTSAQFADDLRHLDPSLEVLQMSPGDVVEVGERITLQPGGLRFVTPSSAAVEPPAESPCEWRPDRGVPPLVDRDPLGYGAAELRTRVDRLLDGPFLEELAASDQIWRERLSRLRVLWRLEVVHPDGADLRQLDFTQTPLGWSAPSGHEFAKLHTSVTASALVALEDRRIDSYAFGFNCFRMVNRLYEAHRAGVSFAGNRDDEPITRLLLPGADDRYVDRLVEELLAGTETS